MEAMPRARVLVVEDTAINIDVLLDALSGQCEMMVAVDGMSALRLVEQTVPDLILLDIMMPDIDGFEVCRRLKARAATRDVPILFLTSMNDEASERLGLELGAVDFIAKPFNPALVQARVRNHLDLKRHRDLLSNRVVERTMELGLTQEATIAGMAILAEFRDNETGAHVRRTQHYVRSLLCALKAAGGFDGLPDVEMTSHSAVLHDIGKVAIPDGILFKSGRLTPEEFEEIKKHTLAGAEVIRRTAAILGTNSFLRLAGEITEFHHERWDGTGYPHGIRGDEIPWSARVMAVADVYDALVSKRPYKPAFPHDRALECILSGDDRTLPEHFCPAVLDALREVHTEFARIAENIPDTSDFYVDRSLRRDS
jgi:putative two-component system response regulator